jgi:endonuclease/exonuclease/phosphatase (EEP) superfamily protein YafD
MQILTYSVHTQTFWPGCRDEMESQADSVVNSIPADAAFTVVGGDFNTATPAVVDAVDTLFQDNGFVRVSSELGATAKAGPVKLALDHIFTRGFRALSSGKLEATQASDHFPLWVRLIPGCQVQ